ncbi:hypothetical protein ACIBG7_16760 [Nonomuraea sp. NPDC050328]|uniref:hypothetical protein n=1 Tax=Nonomuraea sp. NPDC050328 TaxID=3364361 RepID=UPI00379C6773
MAGPAVLASMGQDFRVAGVLYLIAHVVTTILLIRFFYLWPSGRWGIIAVVAFREAVQLAALAVDGPFRWAVAFPQLLLPLTLVILLLTPSAARWFARP